MMRADKDKKRSRIQGAKLSAFFDRELPDVEIKALERELREQSSAENSGHAPDAGRREKIVLDEWRELRVALRNWHGAEMRAHDRDLVQDKLWSSLSAKLAEDLKQRQKESGLHRCLRGWWHVLSGNSVSTGHGNWAMRPSFVAGFAVVMLVLLVAPQVDNFGVNDQKAAPVLVASSALDEAFLQASGAAARRERPLPEELQRQFPAAQQFAKKDMANKKEVDSGPSLVLGSGGVVRPSSRVGLPFSPQRRLVGSAAELTTVGGVGNYQSDNLFEGVARQQFERPNGAPRPTLENDGIDWEWVRSRGPILIVHSDDHAEASMVWVVANK